MDRRKRTARTVALMSLFSMTDTQENVPVASFYGDGSDLVSLIVGIDPVQAGSGDPSPDNVRPISGHTDADVTRTGKNLLRLVESEMTNVGWNREFPFSIKAGTYTLSCQNKFIVGSLNGCQINLQDDGNNNIATITSSYNFGNVEFRKTSVITEEMSNAITKISFQPRASGCTFANIMDAEIMLELGSTATAYEEYRGTTYPIPLGQTVYGGTLDVTTGKLTVDRAMVDLGAETWTRQATGNTYRFVLSGFHTLPGAKTTGGYDSATLCSMYPSNSAPIGSNNVDDCYAVYNGVVLVRDDSYNTADAFKTAMSGVQLCYELATPIVYDLTPTQVTTLIGTNNIWADTGDIKYIEYNI